MRKASAFAPGHISGFFQVCEAEEPERKGSRNCGPCISAGVLTEVEVEPAPSTRIKAFINGRAEPKARTTLAAARSVLELSPGAFEVKVNNISEAPIGAGYGTSGAGALSTVLALSKALRLRLSEGQAVAIAHSAEVSCNTGLGDVGAQARGGLVIGLEPGAPPHGKWSEIPAPLDLRVVCATLGPLPTRDLLRGELLDNSKKFGGMAMERLLKNPTVENFMLISRSFAEALGILDNELRSLIKAAALAGAIGASQVMLGRAVFALVRKDELESVERTLLDMVDPNQLMVARMDFEGAK